MFEVVSFAVLREYLRTFGFPFIGSHNSRE